MNLEEKSFSEDDLNREESRLLLYGNILENLKNIYPDLSGKFVQNARVINKTRRLTEKKLQEIDSDIFLRKKAYRNIIPVAYPDNSYERMEDIFERITSLITKEKKSSQVLKNTVESLSEFRVSLAKELDIKQITLLISIEELLKTVSEKEIYDLSVDEIKSINLTDLEKALREKRALENTLEKFKEAKRSDNLALSQLAQENSELNSENRENRLKIQELQQDDFLMKTDIKNQNEIIEKLESDLIAERRLQEQNQQEIHQREAWIQELKQKIKRKESELQRYSGQRSYEGQYVGNLSDKSSKYHHSSSCPHWKMLVGDYILKLSNDRNIHNSKSAGIFLRHGLSECDKCADSKRSFR